MAVWYVHDGQFHFVQACVNAETFLFDFEFYSESLWSSNILSKSNTCILHDFFLVGGGGQRKIITEHIHVWWVHPCSLACLKLRFLIVDFVLWL